MTYFFTIHELILVVLMIMSCFVAASSTIDSKKKFWNFIWKHSHPSHIPLGLMCDRILGQNHAFPFGRWGIVFSPDLLQCSLSAHRFVNFYGICYEMRLTACHKSKGWMWIFLKVISHASISFSYRLQLLTFYRSFVNDFPFAYLSCISQRVPVALTFLSNRSRFAPK